MTLSVTIGMVSGMQINGAALRAIREASGDTQLSLAARTEPSVSQGRISELEAANVTNVRPGTARSLAQALGVPLAAIIVPAEAAVA